MQHLVQLLPENLRFFAVLIFFPITWLVWTFDFADGVYWTVLKIVFLALPLLLLSVVVVATVLSLITSIFRANRTYYVASILIVWWDGGKSILMYWAGIFRFCFLAVGWIFGCLRIIVLGIFDTIRDIILSPVTIAINMAKNYSKPGVPWLAVLITVFWITLEAIIFSYILTPLVTDLMGQLTNSDPHQMVVTPILAVFLFMVIGGSFACMHGLVEAIEQRKAVTIIKMLLIEFVVMMLEVVFFYREFVDSLAPWIAQMTNDAVQMGLVSVLGIATLAWFGIRSGTWFFFAKYGTPTLMSIISRDGMDRGEGSDESKIVGKPPMAWIKTLMQQFQNEFNWFSEKGNEMLEAFILPPIQILAVMTNSCMILLAGQTLFNIPIKHIADLKDTKSMLDKIKEHKGK